MTKFISILLFLTSINNVIGFYIGNYSNTSTSTFTSTTTSTSDYKNMSLAEILITVGSVTLASLILVYCCCKCAEEEDKNRW